MYTAIFGFSWVFTPVDIFVLLFLVAMAEWQKPVTGVFVATLYIGLMVGFTDHTILLNLLDNPLIPLLVVLGYVVFGFAFAIVRWFMHLYSASVQAEIKIAYESYTQRYSSLLTGLTEDQKYNEFVNSSYFPFGIRKDKWRIATWVLLWPASIVASVFGRGLFNLVNWSATTVSGLFGAMSRNATRSALKK